jgi:hypothetical protein
MTRCRTAPAALAPILLATAGLLTTAQPAPAHDSPRAPQVFSATITPNDIRPNIDVAAEVMTSPNVTSVFAQVAGHTIEIPRVGPGTFRGATKTPRFPRFIHFRLKVTFVARDAAGAQALYPETIKVN